MFSYSDIIGTIGLLATVSGFAYTVRNVKQSKKAAEEATAAAESFGEAALRRERLSILEDALHQMDKLRTLNVNGKVTIEDIIRPKNALIKFKSSNSIVLSRGERAKIQTLIATLGDNERIVLQDIDNPRTTKLLKPINQNLIKHSEAVLELLIILKDRC